MDAAKATCTDLLLKWKPLMGLGHWKVIHHFYRRAKDVPKKHRRTKQQRGALMWCAVDWEYMEANVHTYLPECVGMARDELSYVIRHELAHALVSEMRHWESCPHDHAMLHEERVVTMIAYAFGSTYEDGYEAGRKARTKTSHPSFHSK